MMRIPIFLCALFYTVQISAHDNPEIKVVQTDSLESPQTLNVLVISPYDEVKGRGGSPRVQKCLEDLLANNNSVNVETFSAAKYRSDMVYDKRYLSEILEVTEADIIIMTKLTIRKWGKGPPDGYWDLDIRFYNCETEEQINSRVKLRNVLYTEFCSKIEFQLETLINEILTSQKS